MSNSPTHTLLGKHIFVVEDNLENRIITRLMLGKSGAILEFDMWGRDTVHKLLAFTPVDLILLDLMLPRGASGYNIYKDIREHEALKAVPIVAVSAADPSTALPICRRMGFQGFIAKPLDDELFPAQLTQVLNGQEVWFTGIE